MQEAVSGILVARSREADGLSRMVTVSLVAHAVVLTAIVFMPRGWLTSQIEQRSTPMMISLGGVPGQDTGGMTPIATRAIQHESPETKAPVTPPAVKPPEMIAPLPDVKAKPPTKAIEKPVDKSSTRKPTVGPQVRSGAGRVETGGMAVPFGGLAQGGGGTGGVRIEGDFCCPEYIETMKRLIHAQWNFQQGAAGLVEVKFTIRRDGMLTGVAVEKTSGNPLLDLESRRAVLATQKLGPLPDQFTRPNLTVYLTFEYKR
ncbi:MAG TPA: TonB family protein [Vicinamibacterales bacterium]|jgi:TonB family protein